MIWKFFSAVARQEKREVKLPTVRGKPVYIGGVLLVGIAEKGEFDLKRKKLLSIEIRDASGSSYYLDTSNIRVRITKEYVDLDVAALPKFFEIKMREVNRMIDELKRSRAELDKSYHKLEEALLKGVIGMDVYNEQIKRLQEREKRMRSACIDMEKSIASVGQSLAQLRMELEKKRERLEAKRLLDKLDETEAEELGKILNTLGSINALSHLITSSIIQLRLIC
ncbi:conserved hypothetical protein [Pyrobaculum islandicum DSM 4184]|uniref:CdvA-like coiled-coil domain-containing protein n=1 Tax=Pyrobaculum islandicum (strain DSM 4184 / JCM 9189 / GEO3) TaxID=384616 RepID=A1RSG5_PYRIL|nr:hypothetical protein [Pyrobaculum islandicum]ABL87897.1 conserved hypothetical protein [Pyrobaculum islandicum DSM 4184]